MGKFLFKLLFENLFGPSPLMKRIMPLGVKHFLSIPKMRGQFVHNENTKQYFFTNISYLRIKDTRIYEK